MEIYAFTIMKRILFLYLKIVSSQSEKRIEKDIGRNIAINSIESLWRNKIMQVHYFKSLFRLKAVNLQVLLTQGSSTSFLTILNILQLSKRAVDGNLDLETPPLCEFSLDEAYSQEYDNNIIDIDVSHDIFDVGYHLPLVLGTLYKGMDSVLFFIIKILKNIFQFPSK